MAVSKQAVKNYFESEKDLVEKLKSSIDNKERWNDFKIEFINSIVAYSKSATPQSKADVKNLISRYYTEEFFIASDCFDKIIAGLGIRENVAQVTRNSSSSRSENLSQEAIVRETFEKLGIPFERVEDKIKRSEDERLARKAGLYGKKWKSSSLTKAVEKAKKGERPAPKKDGKVKKTLKLFYFKLTSKVLNAPGTVPPKFLADNRKKIGEASERLSEMISDLSEARKMLQDRNSDNSFYIPSDIEKHYSKMPQGEPTEQDLEYLDDFFDVLCEKQDDLLETMRKTIYDSVKRDDLGEVPKGVIDLSDEELLDFAKRIRNGEDIRSSSDKKSKSYKLLEAMERDSELITPENLIALKEEMAGYYDQYQVTESILSEVETTKKLEAALQIEAQIGKIKSIVDEFDRKEKLAGKPLSREDSKKRENALKIASKIYSSIKEKKISAVITKGEKETKTVLDKAESILLPKIERAKEKGEKSINRTFGKENQEQDQDQEQDL